MGDLGNGLKIWDIVSRIPDALDIDSFRFVINELGNVLGVVAIDELGLDA